MKRLLILLLFLAISLCALVLAMGQGQDQEFKSLKDKAENAVKSRRPDWKIISKDEKDKEVVYNWNSTEEGVRLLIFEGASEQEAAKRMQATIRRLPAGPGKKRADIGDEAYSWTDEPKRFAGIRFRKGNVYVDLVASSEEMAEDLAKDLSQFIKKKALQ